MLAPQGSTPLSLTVMWRRGGLREDEVLGYPGPPSVGPGGWIAIPDWQAGTVTVVDSTGRWIGSVTQKGQGPGETMMAATTAWRADGTLEILDAGNFSIVRLQPPDFHFVDQVKAPATLLNQAVAAGQIPEFFLGVRGRVGVELPSEPVKGEPTVRSVFALEAPGGAIDTLLSIPTATLAAAEFQSWPAPGWATPMAAGGPVGAIAVAGDVPQYRVRVLGWKLRDSLVICRDVAPEPLTRSERGDTSVSRMETLVAALKAAERPKVLAAMGRVFFGTGASYGCSALGRTPSTRSGHPRAPPTTCTRPAGLTSARSPRLRKPCCTARSGVS